LVPCTRNLPPWKGLIVVVVNQICVLWRKKTVANSIEDEPINSFVGHGARGGVP